MSRKGRKPENLLLHTITGRTRLFTLARRDNLALSVCPRKSNSILQGHIWLDQRQRTPALSHAFKPYQGVKVTGTALVVP